MYLVIDVGGTFIKHCVMDRDAEIMEKNKVPTPGRFGNGLLLYIFLHAKK